MHIPLGVSSPHGKHGYQVTGKLSSELSGEYQISIFNPEHRGNQVVGDNEGTVCLVSTWKSYLHNVCQYYQNID
jgi:hypothetical protein